MMLIIKALNFAAEKHKGQDKKKMKHLMNSKSPRQETQSEIEYELESE